MKLFFSSRIGRSMSLVAVGLVAGKGLTVAKEIVVAARFGTTAGMDAFLLALTLVLFPVAVFGSGIWGSLIPLLNKSGDDPERLSHIVLPSLTGVATVGILASLLLIVSAPSLARIFLAVPNDVRAEAFLAIIQVLAWFVPIGLVSVWAGALLAWRKEFFLSSFSDSFPAGGILLLALMGMLADELSMAWGIVGGGLLAMIILLTTVFQRIRIHNVVPTEMHIEVSSTGGRYILTVIAALLAGCMPLMEQYTAARLGEGAISSLGYSQRIVAVVLALVSVPLSRTSLSFMSESSHYRESSVFRRRVRHYTMLCMGGGSIIALASWISAEPVVRFLFQRGAFTGENTLIVADTVRYYSLQIPFCFMAAFMTSLAYAFSRQNVLLIVAAINLAVCVGGNSILPQLLGLPGIALASVITQISSCAALYFSGVYNWLPSQSYSDSSPGFRSPS